MLLVFGLVQKGKFIFAQALSFFKPISQFGINEQPEDCEGNVITYGLRWEFGKAGNFVKCHQINGKDEAERYSSPCRSQIVIGPKLELLFDKES